MDNHRIRDGSVSNGSGFRVPDSLEICDNNIL